MPRSSDMAGGGRLSDAAGILPGNGLAMLVDALRQDGRRVFAPVLRDGAVVCDEISSADDMARGVTVEIAPGHYRTSAGDAPPDSGAWFDHVIGPTPWKRFLHPPRETLHHTHRAEDGSLAVSPAPMPDTRQAFLGVRPCDLAALGVLDRVMTGGAHPDPRYAARRSGTLIVAVDCRVSAATCFCASMGTGPAVSDDHDIALAELGSGGRHRFLVTAASAAGAALMERLHLTPATDADLDEARANAEEAAGAQTRRLDPVGLAADIFAAAGHPRWEDVAARCLTCGNCTMVCPTCFCTTTEETVDLTGRATGRAQRWDSCFSVDYSFVHGGAVRATAQSRYRQWLTHKLSTWTDQFGELGCTGCGRCIAWCPVGIDITEEAAALREGAS